MSEYVKKDLWRVGLVLTVYALSEAAWRIENRQIGTRVRHAIHNATADKECTA